MGNIFMQLTERQKNALKHYHIDIEEFQGVQILFAEKDTTEIALANFISKVSKCQQTIIDYDEDFELYIITCLPKAYGDKTEVLLKELKSGLRDLQKGECFHEMNHFLESFHR